ncbi:mate-domain-containing protein [Phakopsora pachyrhizi]|uniref:Mate-domain-containing protein n=1 Tax=Phakopsora pachyrhizi TaxID=170000 RepID=A0AAV0BBY5_PHAPC|nr:mate-domain-containing protein [Phakopsora pachyrhizi]CAH7684662.1 mate-domain-containing protein [Phakopsora pachyrhizi]
MTNQLVLSEHLQETTTLISNDQIVRYGTQSYHEKFEYQDIASEIRVLATYATPIIGTHLLENSLLIVSVISVGHLGTIELAAASLANITANCGAISINIGFASALDTLCTQAFTSGNPSRTSHYAMRTLLILCLFLVPEFIFFWNAEAIFLLLQQNPPVAQKASQYLRVLSFGLPGYAVFEVTRRWLQSQRLMLPPTIIVLFVAPLNVFLSYLMVWGPETTRIGFIGAPLATAISFTLMGFLGVLYCIFFAPKTAWGGFTRDIFRDLGTNFKLGLSGFTMVASEWWCWEIIGIASSLLGPSTLAAQSIITAISTLLFQFPYATAAAAAVRCGNFLGEGLAQKSKLAAYSAFALGIIVGTINMTFMVCFRRVLGNLFSSEREVVDIVADVLPLVALFQIPDGLSVVLSGVLRGVGKPNIGALINAAGYYVVGLPIGLALTFSTLNLGAYGLWMGMTAAMTSTSIIFTIYVSNMSFEKVMIKSRARMDKFDFITGQNNVINNSNINHFDQNSKYAGSYGSCN